MKAPRSMLPLAALAAAAPMTACAPTRPALTRDQVDAIEVRHIDAAPDDTFRAAAGVMLDRGMVIVLSDRDAGRVSGVLWIGNPWITPRPYDHDSQIEIFIRPAPDAGSLMRVHLTRYAEPVHDHDKVAAFAGDVRQRTLVATPPATP